MTIGFPLSTILLSNMASGSLGRKEDQNVHVPLFLYFSLIVTHGRRRSSSQRETIVSSMPLARSSGRFYRAKIFEREVL